MGEEAKPGYMYQFSADLGSGRLIQVTGNLPVGADSAQFNAELDKVRAALDRQQAKSAVPAIQGEVTRGQATLDALTADLKTLDDRVVGKKLTTQDEAARGNMEISIRNLSGKIATLKEDLARAQKEAE